MTGGDFAHFEVFLLLYGTTPSWAISAFEEELDSARVRQDIRFGAPQRLVDLSNAW